MNRIEEGAVVTDEMPSSPSNPVQQHVDAVIDDLAKGLTTDKQDAALTKALQDRRVQRAFQRPG